MSSTHLQANPYAAPASTLAPAQSFAQANYGGIGRLAYFGSTFLAGIIYQVVLGTVAAGSNAQAASTGSVDGSVAGMVIIAGLFYVVALMFCVGQRMVNMGSSPWWCLAMFVPLFNIIIGGQCLICPAGYARHRTLDGAGKTVLGIFVFLFVMFISMIVGLTVLGSQ